MKRKFISVSLLAATLALSMTGCGTVTNPATGSGVSTTSIPSSGLITLLSNISGFQDRLIGQAGSVEGLSIVKVYNQSNGQLKFLAVSNSDGSFNMPIGDDALLTASITATYTGKQESSSISKSNPPQ